MKFPRVGRVAPLLAMALGAAACDNGLTDINENPNSPTTAPAPYLLTNAQTASVGRAFGANFNMTLTELWAQHFAKIQYIDEDRYQVRPANVDAHWTGFYSGPLRDLAEVMRQGEEQELPNYTAIGNIMSVWTWQLVTDVWGDVPYTEALNGEASTVNVTPKYDTQKDIYTDLMARLKTAQGQLSASGGDFGAADVIYGGDPTKWKKFANSLRLRVAMRVADAPGMAASARSEFEAAIAAGVFTSNADNAVLEYSSSAPSQNPIYVNQLTRDDHAVSKTVVDTLKALHDPRLGIYANPAPKFDTLVAKLPDGAEIPVEYYQGMQNGISAGSDDDLPARSRIGDYFTDPDAPSVLMDYAEVLFLRAEAAARGWSAGGTAADLYAQAIRASMQRYEVSSADIDAYLAQPRVAYNAANGRTQIALQKWIALYGNGPEAYAEYRRTNVPNLVVGPGSANGNRVPVRLFYPSIEQSLNAPNLEAAVGRSGGLTLNDKVWWDVN